MKEPLSKNPTLEYDNEKAYLILKTIFNNANRTFLKTDRSLIDDDVAERTLCGALKSHLEKELSFAKIKGYYVDVEYNRNYGQVKTILDDNFEVVSIQCDLIVHSRGNNIKRRNEQARDKNSRRRKVSTAFHKQNPAKQGVSRNIRTRRKTVARKRVYTNNNGKRV